MKTNELKCNFKNTVKNVNSTEKGAASRYYNESTLFGLAGLPVCRKRLPVHPLSNLLRQISTLTLLGNKQRHFAFLHTSNELENHLARSSQFKIKIKQWKLNLGQKKTSYSQKENKVSFFFSNGKVLINSWTYLPLLVHKYNFTSSPLLTTLLLTRSLEVIVGFSVILNISGI